MEGENRRTDTDLRRLYDEVLKQGQECRELNTAVMREIKELSIGHVRIEERVENISKGMAEVRVSMRESRSALGKLDGIVSEHGQDISKLFTITNNKRGQVGNTTAFSERNVRLMIIMGILVIITLSAVAGINVMSTGVMGLTQ